MFLLLAGRFNPTAAQNIIPLYDTLKACLDISDRVLVYEDKSGQLKLEDILQRDSLFAKRDQPVPNYGVTRSVIWARLDIRPQAGEEFYLGLGFPNIDTVTLYYPSGGKYAAKKTGWTFPNASRDLVAPDLVFKLPGQEGDTLLPYYLEARGRIVILPIALGTRTTLMESLHTNALYYLFYLGLVSMLFFYNLAIYITSRAKEYLFYSTWVFFATLYFMISKGYTNTMLPESFNALFRHVNIVSSLGGISILLFVQTTLRLKEYMPRVIKYYLALLALYLVIIFASLAKQFQLASNLSQLVLMLTVILGLWSGIVMYRRGHSFARYYMYGFVVTLISMTIYILTFQQVFPFNVFTNNSIVAGSGIEMILFSFGLGAKIKAINDEKQAAQELAISALKDKEQLIHEQNVMLETKVEERTQELKLEKKKSDDLLLNILPEEVAYELKENGSTEAKNYAEVSVLFTDFVNFTGISEKLSPKELVSELHICFKGIDEIIEKNRMEKIKTIGDAYLAVCGLPNRCETHALNCVHAGFQILEFMKKRKEEGGLFEIRIGINSGPVVAGIVGIKKFAYDIWGDTVNTASRLQQNGAPGKINVSGSTYELIKSKYSCTYRGKLAAKNKGSIDMYFVD
ncbi:MAG TPA: adenylate/guanylate cyclase domain-containing protein [Saprospiraceae bacterium]|nr:adenylate/guanylate cyclase domain-containing protein [Saprospiraceae bacterium]HNT20857.1 adenylate/guanylate cyclase domain-containing protein [Saprospiraceae bacterium]